MEDVFEKYPYIEIVADPMAPQYRIRYTECVKEQGVIRFNRHERLVPKKDMEHLILDILGKNNE
jgi:hypothetical protein